MKSAVDSFRGKRILVVGDIMLDRFIWGDVERISPEAPVPVVRARHDTVSPGGAGNTAANVASLGGQPHLFGFVGNDAAGAILLGELPRHGINAEGVVGICDACTTEKTRIIGLSQQLVRIDREKKLVPGKARAMLLSRFRKALNNAACVIVSDYSKGVVTRELAHAIIDSCRRQKIPVVVDPKPANAGFFRHATLITPNSKEAGEMSGIAGTGNTDTEKKGRRLSEQLDCNVLVTRGERGMTLVLKDGRALHIPAESREVYDVSGAGDTVAAAMALCIACGMKLEDGAHVANAAAGIAVGKLGTATVMPSELKAALSGRAVKQRSVAELRRIVAQLRRAGKSIVWTNGCFDLLHVGHIRYLRKARGLGDALIVGVNSDASVRRLKGSARPIISEHERVEILSSLEFVDHVLLFDEPRVTRFLRLLRPDVFVKGGDYTLSTLDQEERAAVEKYRGRIALIPLTRERSTSGLIKRILDSHSKS